MLWQGSGTGVGGGGLGLGLLTACQPIGSLLCSELVTSQRSDPDMEVTTCTSVTAGSPAPFPPPPASPTHPGASEGSSWSAAS